MKENGNISVVVLGDEGVGKSSLVSTFVSRHFSDQVPGILTRVRLPPDATLSKCTTTIIDTQGGDTILSNALSLGYADAGSSTSTHSSNAKSSDAAEDTGEGGSGSPPTVSSGKHESAASLLAATSPFRSVDAIILVYDLDKIETFHRLEQHWLPLIEQCYNGDLPVIVAGNKLDLASASDEQNSPSRQQIISLLQQFNFVRECIKCSAKKLLNVDELFLKCQQAVLYPIGPLYDFDEGRLSAACKRAFTRIFRMFDVDQDGLLSNEELNVFQQRIWRVSLTEKDFTGWKKMAMEHGGIGGSNADEDVLLDGKFTLTGFLTIFDVLIARQNRLEVPWKVLRSLGYDEELNLSIPASISPCDHNGLDYVQLHPNDWRLSNPEVEFLASIFNQFDSDGDGILSTADIHNIFSVLSVPSPPWCEDRASLFQDCFSLPRVENEKTPPSSPEELSHPSSPSSILSAGGVTITSSPLPSIDISKDSGSICFAVPPQHKPLSFLSWLNWWHMVATISPSIARAEMFRLGHTFEAKSRKVRKFAPNIPPSIKTPSTFVRALIFGSKGSGKRSLVKRVHGLSHSPDTDDELEYPATSCSASKILRPNLSSDATSEGKEMMVHAITTEVPSYDMSSEAEKHTLRDKLDILLGQGKSGRRPYDMAVLVFDATDEQSLKYVKDLERSTLAEDMPRLFVGTVSTEASGKYPPISEAQEHCKCSELEPPLIVPLGEDAKLDSSILEHLVSCAEGKHQVVVPFRSTPHGERKKRAAKRRKILFIGGLVTVVTVMGFSLTGKKRIASAERGGWFHFFRRLLPF